jgi:hypothetical protein
MNEQRCQVPGCTFPTIAVQSLHETWDPGEPLWINGIFAPLWFRDAICEARHGSPRKEVVFAVSSAESYLLEWVRDDVLSSKYRELNKYFPPDKHRPTTDRFKEVLNSLYNDNRIQVKPDFQKDWWAEFTTLLRLRNGLLHASSSRPSYAGQKKSEGPYPSRTDLDHLNKVQAVGIVIKLIKYLHQISCSQEPEWLIAP